MILLDSDVMAGQSSWSCSRGRVGAVQLYRYAA